MTSPDVPLIAHVAVDVALPHLDRPFDYVVTPAQTATVAVGVRVRVRFAGKLRDGYVLALDHSTDVAAPAPLERVLSPEVVMPPATAGLVRAVADHWGGTFSDVVRLAIPPRHATSEAASRPRRPDPDTSQPAQVLPGYPGAERFLAALGAGEGVRAAWTPVPVFAPPGDWAAGLLDAAAATLSAGRGAILMVPDAAAMAVLTAQASARFGEGSFVTLTADLGPAARYRNYLAVSRGDVRCVLGTRGAVFAPVADLGLIAVWDEGNDAYAEPRAPYPHVREVAALRASREGSGLLLAGYGRTAEVAALAARGWLVPVDLPARDIRRLGPAVRAATDTDRALERDPHARGARLPHDVFTVLRAGLASGPVLVQVPRAGYAPRLRCQTCRAAADCPTCGLPLRGERGPEGLTLTCASCGPLPGPWRCPHCGDTRLRAPQVGVARTAEELGRAFPQTAVVQSWSGHRVETVGAAPALILATPGAEPRPEAGYAAAVLLDAGVLLARPDLRAGEEALRRWLEASALVRAAELDGTVLIVGEPTERAVQALVRLDAAGAAARELSEREQAHFPPAARLVLLEGPRAALEDAEAAWRPVAGAEHFGPILLEDDVWRLTLRCPPERGAELVGGMKALVSERSARKAPGAVRLRVDPQSVG